MRRISLIVGLLFLMLSDASAATTVDDGSFGTIYDVFKAWIQGSLGLAISLIAFIVAALWYLLAALGGAPMKFEYLVTVIIAGFLLGGVVGFAQTMFNIGAGSF